MAEERTFEIVAGPDMLEIIHCFTASMLDALHNGQMRDLYHIHFTSRPLGVCEATKLFFVHGIQSLRLARSPEGLACIEMEALTSIGQFNELVKIVYTPRKNTGTITVPKSEE